MRQETEPELAQLRRLLQRISARLDELERQAQPADGPKTVGSEVAAPPPYLPKLEQAESEQEPGLEARALETKIGSQWLNRIGIIAVLFGAAYFLKFAFESNWIGPSGRILIGLLAGSGVLLWSERFRRHGSNAFAHSLKAVGLGVLYLSLWASFQLYHLVPAGVAFAAMAAVTGCAMALAMTQNAQILAGMALAGGLLTPALVSTGEDRHVFLFSYLALLSATAVFLGIRRQWNYLAIAALLGTFGFYFAWRLGYHPRAGAGSTFFFVMLFFAIFLLPALFPDREDAGPVRVVQYAGLLLNAVLSFFAVYELLDNASASAQQHQGLLPWVVLGMAAVYLVVSRWVRVETLRLLHIAVALGLITVALPLRFEAHFLTLGWLAESAAILYIAARRRPTMFAVGGLVALGLGVARLVFMDDFYPHVAFWNMRVLLFVLAIAITGSVARFARTHGQGALWRTSAVVVTGLALLELDHELSLAILPFPGTQGQDWHGAEIMLNFVRSAVWMAYGVAVMALGFWKRIAFYRYLALALLAITIGKVFLYDIEQLNQGYRVLSFIALGVILLAVSYAYQQHPEWLRLTAEEHRNA